MNADQLADFEGIRIKQGIYMIRDLTAGVGRELNGHFRNHAEASRWFASLVANPNSIYNAYPTEFDLVYLADWDCETGQVFPQPHVVVANGAHLVPQADSGEQSSDRPAGPRAVNGDTN